MDTDNSLACVKKPRKATLKSMPMETWSVLKAEIFGEHLRQGPAFRQNYPSFSPIGDRLSVSELQGLYREKTGTESTLTPIRVFQQSLPGDLAGHLAGA